MKIAITGKGGVGKSTISGILSLMMSKQGKKVVAVDADPDANLASALGLSEDMQKEIVPISKQIALIEERTGAKVNQYGQMFKLNPEVSDVAEKYAIMHEGVALLVLGAIKKGGSGCACPENVFLRSLVTDLILYKNEALVIDMEAGIEHLGRSTAKGVDMMFVVVEPGQRSLDTALRIKGMANDIGLSKIKYIANKVMNKEDQDFIKSILPENDLLGIIPFHEVFRRIDKSKSPVLETLTQDLYKCFEEILSKIDKV
jgi:CO dehydrogenase maturation factor